MLLMNIPINENLDGAERALKAATCENIIERCREYLSQLTAYREELYKLRGTPEINLQQSSPLARELVEQTRKAIRRAVETTTRRCCEIEFLLGSFTAIGGYEAVKTFNQLEYKGFTEWELRANEIRLKTDTDNQRLTIQQAVETASLLRREAYIKYKTSAWQ